MMSQDKEYKREPIKPPEERGFVKTGWCRCDDCGNEYRRAPKKCKCGCTLFKTTYRLKEPL